MLKQRIKQFVLYSAKSAGLFAAARGSRWRRQRLLILCYHGISLDDEHLWNPGLYMAAGTLRARLEMLRAGGYQVIPLEQGLKGLYSGELPERAVILTFDDGAYDFYAQAYPLLREFGYPATLYLATFYCRYQAPVFDTVCSYILWKGRGRRFDASGCLPEGGEVRLDKKGGWRATFARLYRHVRDARLSAAEKDELAERLAQRLGVDYERIRARRMFHFMNPEEVREVARGGVSIQLHTHRHRTPRDRELFDREVRDNQAAIRAMLDSAARPVHFCYPSGDCQPEFLPWLRELGVQSATTCAPGLAGQHTEPLVLPRLLDMRTLSPIEVEGWLTGFSAWLPHRKNGLQTADLP